ncbi:MAG: hypothetical protein ACNYPI_11340 [Arenicellales bacterium WSBS_2016_MAG_OTU3]
MKIIILGIAMLQRDLAWFVALFVQDNPARIVLIFADATELSNQIS